jgi:hypothetical protein
MDRAMGKVLFFLIGQNDNGCAARARLSLVKRFHRPGTVGKAEIQEHCIEAPEAIQRIGKMVSVNDASCTPVAPLSASLRFR